MKNVRDLVLNSVALYQAADAVERVRLVTALDRLLEINIRYVNMLGVERGYIYAALVFKRFIRLYKL